jgi:hypothetical protein
MQKLVLFVLLALCVNANAFFVGGNIWDSRIQSDNVIREPAGALGFSLETGVFDEPENFIDYKMSIELRRFGYSFDDGEQTVAFLGIGIKPMIWSVTYKKFVADAYVSFFFIFNHDELNEKTEDKMDSFADYLAGSYGFRLGYKLTDKLTLSVMGDFVQMDWRYRNTYNYDLIDDAGFATYMIGGFGLSVLYNIF